jgi:hypothetical protein
VVCYVAKKKCGWSFVLRTKSEAIVFPVGPPVCLDCISFYALFEINVLTASCNEIKRLDIMNRGKRVKVNLRR